MSLSLYVELSSTCAWPVVSEQHEQLHFWAAAMKSKPLGRKPENTCCTCQRKACAAEEVLLPKHLH